MTQSTKARVRWLRPGEGGRKTPPPGPVYSTVARFELLKDRWPDEAWSVVLDISGPADDRGEMMVDVRMLVPDAPTELLKSGSRFELFEGARRVAECEVL